MPLHPDLLPMPAPCHGTEGRRRMHAAARPQPDPARAQFLMDTPVGEARQAPDYSGPEYAPPGYWGPSEEEDYSKQRREVFTQDDRDLTLTQARAQRPRQVDAC